MNTFPGAYISTYLLSTGLTSTGQKCSSRLGEGKIMELRDFAFNVYNGFFNSLSDDMQDRLRIGISWSLTTETVGFDLQPATKFFLKTGRHWPMHGLEQCRLPGVSPNADVEMTCRLAGS